MNKYERADARWRADHKESDKKFEAFQRGMKVGKEIGARKEVRKAASWAHTNLMGGEASFSSGGFKGYGIELEGITAGASGVLGTQSYMGDEPTSSFTMGGEYKRSRTDEGAPEDTEGGMAGEAMGSGTRPMTRTKTMARVPERGRESTTSGTSLYGTTTNISPELKFYDSDSNFTNVPVTGLIVPSVNTIRQGVTESNRVGRKCTLKEIHWKVVIRLDRRQSDAGVSDSDIIRFIMYVDMQTNGQPATVLDILETEEYLSFRNLANAKRFKVMADRRFIMNRVTLGVDFDANAFNSSALYAELEFNKRVNIPIEFDGETGAVSEMCTNNVGLLVITETFAAGYVSRVRVRYNDM